MVGDFHEGQHFFKLAALPFLAVKEVNRDIGKESILQFPNRLNQISLKISSVGFSSNTEQQF